MNLDGKTRVCGLLGYPVEHTRSPLIHNYLAELTGINLAYLPFLTEPERLKAAVEGAYALDILGLNVTIPHKEKVIAHLKDTDPLAARIGAVNTLVRVEGGYKGYNTDMPGLYRAMLNDGVKLKDETIVILGAGGVARAVAVMLADHATKIYMLNRTVEKAKRIAEEVNAYVESPLVTPLPLSAYNELPDAKFLAIQTTNVGMYPHMKEAVIEDPAFYAHIHTGYDLIFNPAKTRFMELVEEAGGLAYNGLKMLLYQGIIAYELWNNVQISEEDAKKVYDRLRTSV